MALLPLLLLTCGPAADASGVLTPPYPGLPTQALPDGWRQTSGWFGTQGNGLSKIARAQQWVKISAQAVAALAISAPVTDYPADDPQGRRSSQLTTASAYLSSPKGAKYGYGVGLPVTVHTVAFGSIPIQVVVQLEQVRDTDDLPVPLTVAGGDTIYNTPHVLPGGATSSKSTIVAITGKVRVRLAELSVDGVDVGLRDCESAPIDLDLHADPVWWAPVGSSGIFDPLAGSFAQPPASGTTAWNDWLAARGLATLNGGAVSGEVDIPAFTHCLTKAGEDLSPLLTNTVSGAGNEVTVGFSSLNGGGSGGATCDQYYPGTTILGPRGPFSGDPSDCKKGGDPPAFDYPERTG